ncbi:GNAT family N-acetyltransferase [Sediminitomix flava]|uniref:Acetyltransferase (GNAT) family protein n=1 Tax=Sediminitomix flava TaxID=379075 RepID=A0A315Z7H5_SEDFL|nr:GNAT family N-acetyltransferase [Sediminitomix flava]PWJ40912.1 acetyltransferase (GNAT) family protein [Sediminitomix flava]
MIKDIKKLDIKEWEEYWKKCSEATFFHSPEWFQIWAKYLNGKLYYSAKLIIFSDGKTALLPYAYTRKLGAHFFLLSPRNNYGGWISSYELSKSDHISLESYILKNMKNLQWIIQPNLQTYLNKNILNNTTSILYYKSNFNQTFQNFKKGPKYSYKKAIREGCKLVIAEDLQEWKTFYEIYLKTVERWSKVNFLLSWEELKLFYQLKSDHINLYLVSWNDKIISGGLFLYGNQSVHYWQGASLHEHHDKRAMHYMIIEVIKESQSKGFKMMDMGPSHQLKGVLDFKKGFNTDETTVGIIQQKSLKGTIIKKGAEWKKRIHR